MTEKDSGNSPRPRGSGEKYKNGRSTGSPEENGSEGAELKSASEMLELTKEFLSQREFHSIEEVNQELAKFHQYHNSLPRAPFLGLSSAQMHNILRMPFSLKNELFDFKGTEKDDLINIPILEQTLYFLKKINEAGEMKATQKGNLPRAFVVELYHQFFSNDLYTWLPSREYDLPQSTRLKHLLDMSGLMKKRSNKFSLTRKGEKLLLNDKVRELFNELTLAFFNKWNWGYNDRYPEFSLIQKSAAFNIYLLHKKAQDWILGEELEKFYLNAFPDLANEASGMYVSPEKQVANCFSIRFLERICVPMGLLLSRSEGDHLERKTFYKATPFFRKNFIFHV